MYDRVDFIEKITGHRFTDTALLLEALTHSSYANEKGCVCNERLEFLGDAVLGLIMSDYLFSGCKPISEGDMSRIRALCVCEKALSDAAQSLELGSVMRLGHGEALSGGAARASVLADAFEALIAALYLDGGMETARRFVMTNLQKTVDRAIMGGLVRDYKTALQEKCQAKNAGALLYTVVEESGPDHAKSFVISVSLAGKVLGTGKGRSKKAAEQAAAQAALELLS